LKNERSLSYEETLKNERSLSYEEGSASLAMVTIITPEVANNDCDAKNGSHPTGLHGSSKRTDSKSKDVSKNDVLHNLTQNL